MSKFPKFSIYPRHFRPKNTINDLGRAKSRSSKNKEASRDAHQLSLQLKIHGTSVFSGKMFTCCFYNSKAHRRCLFDDKAMVEEKRISIYGVK